MPEGFMYRIKIMRQHKYIQLVSIIIAMMSLALILGSLLEKGMILPSAAWALSICFLVSTIAFIQSHRSMKSKSENLPAYIIPVSWKSAESIAGALCADEIIPDTYVTFASIKGIKIRTMILYRPGFHEKELANHRKRANKQLNKRYPIPAEEPFFKAVARLRVNMVICDEYSNDLSLWINRNPVQLMQRNESILSVAIALKEGQLIIPAIMSNYMDIKQLNKYEIAVNWLVDNLAS